MELWGKGCQEGVLLSINLLFFANKFIDKHFQHKYMATLTNNEALNFGEKL